MIRIYKNNDIKLVTQGAYNTFYKPLGYKVVVEESKRVIKPIEKPIEKVVENTITDTPKKTVTKTQKGRKKNKKEE